MLVLTDLSARGSRCRRVPLFATLLFDLELCDTFVPAIHLDNEKTIMPSLHRYVSLHMSFLTALT